ncbi:hypothetical protein EGW08_002726 [Elysia chlorotica]|uniref:C2H2-type domain-containing protein n=1 Tax=Elysia chlorotica TaxID=188477 RepID=A0A433U6P2_ELYCH|nr:hypothetical protein EGW08_002726 [Elysia chlorotica]
MAGVEVGPNDIVIHLVNPYRCGDCGAEFFLRTAFLEHIAGHIASVKAEKPCHQIVCVTSVMEHAPKGITVTRDILQINDQQLFELQDPSLDVSQLSPLKALEQAGILKLPQPKQTQTAVPLLVTVDGTFEGGRGSKRQVSLLRQQQQHQQQPGVRAVRQEAVSSRYRELSREFVRDGQLVPITDSPEGDIQYVNSDLSDPKIINAIMEQAMLDADQTIKVEDGSFSMDNQVQMVIGEKQLLIEMRTEEEREKFIRGDQKRATLRDIQGLACPVCSQHFPTVNLLELHQAEAHPDLRLLTCSTCPKSFTSLGSLRRHRLSHQRQHSCPICHRTYERLAQLMFHMKHHDRKKFIQFGSNFHEVRVVSSRNEKGQMVQEHYLLLLLSKEEQSNIETELAASLHTEPHSYGSAGMHSEGAEIGSGKSEEFASSKENEGKRTNVDTEESNNFKMSDLSKTNGGEKSSEVMSENAEVNVNTVYTKADNSTSFVSHEVQLDSTLALSDIKKKLLYKCGHCKRVFFTRPALSRHLIKHTNTKPFQCEKCLKSFRDKTDLVHHFKTHTKPVQCPACYTTFSKSLYLRNHLNNGCPSHRSDDRITVLEDSRCLCKVCDKVLKSKANAIRHLRIHDFQERLKLKQETGNNNFESATGLSQDTSDHYKPLDSSIGFQCLLCGEEMRFKSFMVTHVRMHLNQRPFKCEHCPKSFFARHVLRKHELNHTRPYKCPVCGKGFMRRYQMTKHFSKRHNLPDGAEDPMEDITELPDRKMIQCDICGKTMKQCHKRMMLYHIRLHKDVRPFKCDHCPKSFISATARKKHSLTHTKPYVCQVCGMGFSRRYLLTKHFKSSCFFKVDKSKKKIDKSFEQEQNSSFVSRSTQSGGLNEEEHHDMHVNDTHVNEETSRTQTNGTGSKYFCEPCSKHFTVHDAFLRHMKTFSKATSCKYCKQLFENKHIAIAHQRSCLGTAVSEMATSQCKKGRSLGWRERIKIMEEVERTIQTVSEVGKGATGNMGSSTQLRGDSERGEVMDTALSLSRTVETLKSKHGRYGCPQCERIFSTPRGLKIHASSHVRLFKCEICDTQFMSIKALRSHHHREHEKKDRVIPTSGGTEELTSSSRVSPETVKETEMTNSLPSYHSDQNISDLSLASEDGGAKTSSDALSISDPAEQELVPSKKSSPPHLGKDEKILKETPPELKLMQLGTKGRPYRCQFCRKRFTEQENLEAHVILVH